MTRKFQKKKEDFVCENCGKQNKGNGYTNHCIFCLWSKHVDVNPGDRENDCQGMMRPVEVYWKNQQWRIIHQCQKCGEKKEIKLSEKDSRESLEKIIKESAAEKIKKIF